MPNQLDCILVLLQADTVTSASDNLEWCTKMANERGYTEAAGLLCNSGSLRASHMYNTAKKGDYAALLKCISADTELDWRSSENDDFRGATALIAACRNGHLDCVKLLMNR